MSTKKISRRDFLKVAGISAAAIGLHRSFHLRQCRRCGCSGSERYFLGHCRRHR